MSREEANKLLNKYEDAVVDTEHSGLHNSKELYAIYNARREQLLLLLMKAEL